MPHKKRRRSAKRKKNLLSFTRLLQLVLLLLLPFAVWVGYLDYTVRARFDGKKWSIPARVFAQPLELYEGLTLQPAVLETELKALGYQQVKRLKQAGQFSRQGNRYRIYTKGFTFWDKTEQPGTYQVHFSGNRVSRLEGAGDAWVLRLEPREIGSIYPGHGEDRILVTLNSIPPLLGEALIAVEDKNFARHHGISGKSIARAILANIKAGAIVQGGSTITQQLVKNFFLTHERSVWRKAQEAIMSVLLELRYNKAHILEAYVNEVYLGQSGPRSIHGFGLAAQHYFNQPLASLQPHQLALLVGLVKGASYYNPWRHPERARTRRNLVLQIMADQQLIDPATHRISSRQPLDLATFSQRQQGDYPAYLDLVKRQLLRDYREQDLHSQGLRIFTPMSPPVQHQMEAVVVARMQRLNHRPGDNLQAAALITAVGSGEILALTGDRQPRYSGFNRALDARRQVGSLVKPFVYLTALMQPERYQLSSRVDDAPVSLTLENGDLWRPENFSGESHGELLLYQALAFSYNQATARLGLDLGIEKVIATLRQAGLERNGEAFPALILGALDLSPLEVSHLYHTLAADGVYTPLRAIRAVLDARNQPLQRYALASEPRFTPEQSHLVHFVLQAVMRTGTGRNAYNDLPAELAVAGKTGTTNKQRDSWFAGYSGDHLGVVWVGNDDNTPTRLTGSSGALTIWTHIFSRLNTRGIAQKPPENIAYYWIDSQSGLRSVDSCEGALLIPFVTGSQPQQAADCQTRKQSSKGWFKLFR